METANDMLAKALEAVARVQAVDIRGKHYKPVAGRVAAFREGFGLNGRIRITDREIDNEVVRMRAVVEVKNEAGEWEEVGQGQAEEFRATSMVNKTSAIENCETSAIGRALAQIGLHGGEYASANEVVNAISEQQRQVIEAAGYFRMVLKLADLGQTEEEHTARQALLLKAGRDVAQAEGEDFFRAVWKQLPTPEQRAIKAILGTKEAA